MFSQACDVPVTTPRRAVQPERGGGRLHQRTVLAAEIRMPDGAEGIEAAQLLALEQLGHRRHERQRDAQRLSVVEPLVGGSLLQRRDKMCVDEIRVREAIEELAQLGLLGERRRYELHQRVPLMGAPW